MGAGLCTTRAASGLRGEARQPQCVARSQGRSQIAIGKVFVDERNLRAARFEGVVPELVDHPRNSFDRLGDQRSVVGGFADGCVRRMPCARLDSLGV